MLNIVIFGAPGSGKGTQLRFFDDGGYRGCASC